MQRRICSCFYAKLNRKTTSKDQFQRLITNLVTVFEILIDFYIILTFSKKLKVKMSLI